MQKIYQRISSPTNGDCMRAVIASLFDDEYENVPHFVEIGENWFDEFRKYTKSKGYGFNGILHNKKWLSLENPLKKCFDKVRFVESFSLNKTNVKRSKGVNGFYYASVLSPKFFTWQNPVTHAVICDQNLNIVHDPSESYKDILNYPLADVIGCNGIINLYQFKKLK